MMSILKSFFHGKTVNCLGLLVFFLCCPGCFGTAGDSVKKIKESGKLTVITDNNPSCFYYYREARAGFEYDLAKAFADYLGVDLEIVTPGWSRLFESLENGNGDLIAAGLTRTPAREKLADFSEEYLAVQQHVVVHKNNRVIKKIGDLQGRKIHIRKGTSYHERLMEMKNDGLDITLVPHEEVPTEELLRQVAEKEIGVTVADSNIALLNRRYYPDLKLAFPIEEQQSLGWAVKKGNRSLLEEINRFFKEIEADGSLGSIYQKYYANAEIFDYVDLKKYHQRLDTRLPRYRKLIQKMARKYGFDWRLIAAVIYQESHFDPGARSPTGVVGLMQLTRDTAEEVGVSNRRDPRQSITGGVKYLKKLYDKYTEAQDPDRMLITLASYNIGRGHVLDARRIAEKRGLNPDSWSALEQVLPLLRFSKYYKKTRYGYCRGTEPVRYVRRILTYYDILKREVITVK